MKAGYPLDDEDRAPWLTAIAAKIDAWRARGDAGVVTCSALKWRYRDVIIGNRPDVRLVYLEGSRKLIGERVGARRGHFMPASLLDSQFAALEPPAPEEHAITVSVDAPIDNVVVQPLPVVPTAATITFNGLTGSHVPFTLYSESGYLVSVTNGIWGQGQAEGNPVPSIFTGAGFEGSAVNTATVTAGGSPFTFSGLDLAAISDMEPGELEKFVQLVRSEKQ